MSKAKKKIVGILKSFFYAFRGIWFCFKTERNIRIHCSIAFYVLLFSRFYDFSRTDYAIILLSIGAVICAEMLNTAIEASVDLSSPNYHELAKKSKDIAAGAVLVSAIIAACIGVVYFFDAAKIHEIFDYYKNNTAQLIGLAVTFVCWLALIFSVEPSNHITDKEKDKK